ncbi:protein of unknown function [bacterium A37T11]|nr:protein of unknown function [bacterium A37T11]
MTNTRNTGTKCSSNLWSLLTTIGVVLMMGSCKVEEMVANEATKEIQGTWHISKATRNGTDITDKFDFSGFKIVFQTDGSFQLGQPVPFIVSQNGRYALDDPQYPFQIKFDQENQAGEATSAFEYPIVDGQRSLTLTFSTGCATNIYRYTLRRD